MSKKAGISEIYVTKFSGERQLFSRQKVVRTCRRMHASQDAAETVADKIESRLYDGITTKEILKLIFRFLKEHKPEVAFQLDLRESIALLRPKPDFEQFIALVLEAEGYEVERNLIIPGKCTEHEVDCIARRGRDIVYVEVKHHYRHHTFSGLGTFLDVLDAQTELLTAQTYRVNAQSAVDQARAAMLHAIGAHA